MDWSAIDNAREINRLDTVKRGPDTFTAREYAEKYDLTLPAATGQISRMVQTGAFECVGRARIDARAYAHLYKVARSAVVSAAASSESTGSTGIAGRGSNTERTNATRSLQRRGRRK